MIIPLFSWCWCLIQGWCRKELLDASYSNGSKVERVDWVVVCDSFSTTKHGSELSFCSLLKCTFVSYKKILPNLFNKMEMVIMFLLVEIHFKFIWKWIMKGITSQKKVWIPSDYSELKLWKIWLWNSQALSNLNNRKTEKFRFCLELYMTIEDPLK